MTALGDELKPWLWRGAYGGTRPAGRLTPRHSRSIGRITGWITARRQKVTGPGWPSDPVKRVEARVKI